MARERVNGQHEPSYEEASDGSVTVRCLCGFFRITENQDVAESEYRNHESPCEHPWRTTIPGTNPRTGPTACVICGVAVEPKRRSRKPA
jgi:hypothetical protein